MIRAIPVRGMNNYNTRYFESESITYKQMMSDLDDLFYLMENAYIGYDDAKEKGLDLKTISANIEKLCEDQMTIRKVDFIQRVYDTLSPYITDSHLSMEYNGDYVNFAKHYYIYFSSVYVRESLGNYVVISSNEENILAGDKIQYDADIFFKCYSNDGSIYRLGVLSNTFMDTINVKCNNHDQSIKVFTKRKYNNSRNKLYYNETEKTIYIKINSFIYDNTDCLDKFVKLSDIARAKDYVILDMSDNPGGTNTYIFDFLSHLCFEDKNITIPSITRFLNSPCSITAFCKMIENYAEEPSSEMFNEYFMLKEEQQKHPKREYITDATEELDLPDLVFKGKLILITNRETASSAEAGISYAKYFLSNTDQLIHIGENTAGWINSGNVCFFVLPESGICVNVPIEDYSESYKALDSCHGEGKGFYPDYWVEPQELNRVIFNLTNDFRYNKL